MTRESLPKTEIYIEIPHSQADGDDDDDDDDDATCETMC